VSIAEEARTALEPPYNAAMTDTPDASPDRPAGPALADAPDSAAVPGTEPEPDVVPLSPRARAIFIGAVAIFLVLPAVVMFLMITSGPSLGDWFNNVLSDLGRQLSGVGERL